MSNEDPGDLVLLDRWCAGDNDAGTRLFRRHLPAVYRFFATKVEREDVDEPVQETFLVCVRKRDQFRRESSFRTFLFAIARLVLHEHWRRHRGQAIPVDFDEISVASLSTSVGTRIARREEQSRLLEAMRELPLDQQLLLELYYWEKLEGDELAPVFNVEPATIRGRLFRAREALRARIQLSERRGEHVTEDADFDAWARALRPLVDEDAEGPSDEKKGGRG
jgi:RNA polymerase sigma factor (sigma-70 family)